MVVSSAACLHLSSKKLGSVFGIGGWALVPHSVLSVCVGCCISRPLSTEMGSWLIQCHLSVPLCKTLTPGPPSVLCWVSEPLHLPSFPPPLPSPPLRYPPLPSPPLPSPSLSSPPLPSDPLPPLHYPHLTSQHLSPTLQHLSVSSLSCTLQCRPYLVYSH